MSEPKKDRRLYVRPDVVSTEVQGRLVEGLLLELALRCTARAIAGEDSHPKKAYEEMLAEARKNAN